MNYMVRIKKINIRVVAIQLVYLVVCNLIFGFTRRGDYTHQLVILAILTIINIVLFLTFAVIKNYKIYSIGGLFILLSYIFHFGQVFTNVFSPGYRSTSTNFLLINHDANLQALKFAFNIITIISVFVLTSWNSKKPFLETKNYLSISLNELRILAWIVFFVTTPFEVLYFFKLISTARQGGAYGLIYHISISGWQFQMGALSVLGFSLLICAYSEYKHISFTITAVACLFYCASMISGSRIYAVVSICIILYCYINFVKKITPMRMVIYIAIGIVFATALHSIMRLRMQGAMTIGSIIGHMKTLDNNIIVALLDEFGGTIYTVTVTIKEVPRYLSYNYGKSYVLSLATIGINIGGILDRVIKNVEYTTSFITKYTFGGSYIGELYYNFGYYAYIFAPLIGVFIGKISNAMNYYAEKRDYYRFSFFVMFMYGSLIWVRNYCNILARNIAWGAFLLVIIVHFIKKKTRGSIK